MLNTGTTPTKITVYYGMGKLEEPKPYTMHALLITAGPILIAGAAIKTFRRAANSRNIRIMKVTGS